MDWVKIKPGLVSMVRSLAAEDMLQPLPDGTVTWFGAAVPFIAPETQAGIYMRILTHSKRGRPGRRYTNAVVNGVPLLREVRTKQEKFTLQIQAKSLEENEFSGAQVWIDRLTDNIWDRSVLSYLKTLGLAIIEVRPTVELQEKTPVDGTIGYDNREVSVVSVDIVLHCVNVVIGSLHNFIEHVGISGTVSGSSGSPVVPLFTV